MNRTIRNRVGEWKAERDGGAGDTQGRYRAGYGRRVSAKQERKNQHENATEYRSTGDGDLAMATIKERPILMSAPMVRALLAGRKTQTRRIVKPRPDALFNMVMGKGLIDNDGAVGMTWWSNDDIPTKTDKFVPCPYGKPGDRLWVRETWCRWGAGAAFVGYRATDEGVISPDQMHDGWKPSIHMFREDARIVLEITGVRVERLQDISEADAVAEGVMPGKINVKGETVDVWFGNPYVGDLTARDAYATLWDDINNPRGYCAEDEPKGWMANPFVWVVEFKVCQPLPQKSEAVQA